MTLQKAYLDGAAEIIDSGDAAARTLVRTAALCCDGAVTFEADGTVTHIGDPTETAIVFAAHQFGDTKETLGAAFPRLAELPFDSDRKRMSVVVEHDGRRLAIVKGAFDGIAPLCTAGDTERARQVNDEMSRKALRVLAVAVREIDALPEVLAPETLEQDLTFLGLVGMIDPPREEARDAVAVCREAGIRPVMITGDHVVTASAIAKNLGILQDGDRAITGAELDAMSETELDAAVEQIRCMRASRRRIRSASSRRGRRRTRSSR